MSINDGGPAFPRTGEVVGICGESRDVPGMSLRDYFAGQVVAAVVVHGAELASGDPEQWAADAYIIADAMLKARNAGQ